jgi:hypothetical protein
MSTSISARLGRVERDLSAGHGRHVMIWTEQDGHCTECGQGGSLSLYVPGAPDHDDPEFDVFDLLDDAQRALVSRRDDVVVVCYDPEPAEFAKLFPDDAGDVRGQGK